MNAKQHNPLLAQIGNLLILAEIARQRKTTTKDVTRQDATLVVVQERQPKTSVSEDSTKQS